MPQDLLVPDTHGLYCPAGDFHIDPWRPGGAARAIVTHAHSDHARTGAEAYLAAASGEHLLRARLGRDVNLQTLPYGEKLRLGDVTVSLHPAGHVLGSAQVRVESKQGVWVVSGDYKRAADPTCAAFEPQRCDVFVTESTFGLPVYRWPEPGEVMTAILNWWTANADAGRTSLLAAYAVGKAQRLLKSVADLAGASGSGALPGPIFAHGAIGHLNDAYRASGVELPETPNPVDAPQGTDFSRALVLTVPSALGSTWVRRFKNAATGFASGWMRVRGQRRRRAVDAGFILSDHADWQGLVDTIDATGAERVYVTHGNPVVLIRYLRETREIDARELGLSPWNTPEDGPGDDGEAGP